MADISEMGPLSDERVALFALLLDTNARLARASASVLEDSCNLPLAWFDVLLQLRRAPQHQLKMTQIAEAIVHSTGGTTRLIDRIEEAGLVARSHCPTDRRAVNVTLTTLGNERLDVALAVHLDYLEQHMISRLSCEERTTLTALLCKLTSAD